ncbi:gamma-glutamyl-gamma-aminobutyraldehyde dehydrogenase [Sulfitobacter undariae]|uniref:Gamma-glutamyl-gamma-aminobutyraldehyde dehydrogenase n=1 Tax=Sulfitobacter undariae TaxID=1563671 RepID=A0A7W6H1M0_9RHOB|nr:aldehyde dehydrogenase family protein [Sulfitobacter undariae]MBB3995690.1 gamma-glutamyl-gamma-aminobutyraldehyde dehydrogenase [Sulfitobacter undariae]
MITQDQINTLRNTPVEAGQNIIDGIAVSSATGAALDVISPIDGTVLSTIAAGGGEDIDRAVIAARRAFDDGRWSRMAPAARGRILQRIGDAIAAEAQALAVLGVRDNGTEISMAIKAEPMSAAGTFRYYGELCDKQYGEVAPTAPGTLGMVLHAPVGVVGAIVPWNFPLMIGAWKIAPALAAGNSVVVKPSEIASLSLLRLVEICHEAGLPDGVLNVVTGTGIGAGAALGRHMDVDVLTFTGSGGVGRRLMEYAAASNLKRVYLELGGKSPLVVFDDTADLDAAAKTAVGAIFRNSGQVCIAASRIIVARNVHAEFTGRVVAYAEKMAVGDPLDLGTAAGAIASQTQMDNILSAIDLAKSEGADLRTGGTRLHADTGGFYIAPTVFDNAAQVSAVVQKEVFGPVVTVQPFDTEEEAVALANGTDYGLSAGVFTRDISRAHRMVESLRAGVVHVNTYGGADNTVPLGGVGQSGNGHDKSPHGMDKFRDLKTAWIQL